jgi:alpha-tubulin suppressor-like RCC1 family protein
MPAVLDLPLEVLIDVCGQLDFFDLTRVAATCNRFRHGDGGLETVDLPTKSPVVTVLCDRAFPGGVGIPNTRPIGCSESWVAYLARCARQRRYREAPPMAAGNQHTLLVDAAGRLLACGKGAAVGHGDENVICSAPTLVTALAEDWVQSVAAGPDQSRALGWDGRVFSWGHDDWGLLGHGDRLAKPSSVLVEGLKRVRSIAASQFHSLAVTRSGAVFEWGKSFRPRVKPSPRPVRVGGFGGVHVHRACAGEKEALAIGKNNKLFSWGLGKNCLLGHGGTKNQPSPERVMALRNVLISSIAVGGDHALALAVDGMVYAWGENDGGALLGIPHVKRELLPQPIEALRGVRVGSVAAADQRSYAVADTGEVWAWGRDGELFAPIGHGEHKKCPLPKPIESLRGVKVDAVTASGHHTLALADDGSVYTWGHEEAAKSGALGLGASVSDAGKCVPTPQHILGLRVACGL